MYDSDIKTCFRVTDPEREYHPNKRSLVNNQQKYIYPVSKHSLDGTCKQNQFFLQCQTNIQ